MCDLAAAHTRLFRFEEAGKQLDRARALIGDTVQILRGRANIYVRTEKYAAARELYVRLLAENDVYLQLESFNGITPELAAAIPSRLVQRRHARPDYVFSTFALPE